MTATEPSRTHAPVKRRHSTRTLARRLKAAGLDGDDPPEDIDEFRYQFARRIYMFINDWHGCPELLCARNRGCMAPGNICANIPPPTDEMERDWPRVQAEIYKAVKKRLADAGLEDE